MQKLPRGFINPALLLLAVLVIVGGVFVYQHTQSTTSAGNTTYDTGDLSFEYPSTWHSMASDHVPDRSPDFVAGITFPPGSPIYYTATLFIDKTKDAPNVSVGLDYYQYTLKSFEYFGNGPDIAVHVGNEHGVERSRTIASYTTPGSNTSIPDEKEYRVYVLHNGYVYFFEFLTHLANDQENKPVLDMVLRTLRFKN
ncbi:MAG: hypothetical protein ACYC75_01570 [Minisyncoccota bacterium]